VVEVLVFAHVIHLLPLGLGHLLLHQFWSHLFLVWIKTTVLNNTADQQHSTINVIQTHIHSHSFITSIFGIYVLSDRPQVCKKICADCQSSIFTSYCHCSVNLFSFYRFVIKPLFVTVENQMDFDDKHLLSVPLPKNCNWSRCDLEL